MKDSDDISVILTEWQEQRDRGEAPDPAAVVRSHPELADALAATFAAQALLEVVAGQPAQAQPSAPPSPWTAPQSLGEFRILREIGRGGMGVVFEAEQTTMRRRVALKVLFPSVTNSPRAVERFQREARAAGRLHHTHIVPVYSMGEDRGVWFYAMELVSGRALDRVLEEERQRARWRRPGARPRVQATAFGGASSPRSHYARIAHAFAGVAEGLQTAHEAGVVHRDVKPANLVLDAEGTLRLMDFGLARVADEGEATRSGQILGTPVYMSPEQVTGAATSLDARSDVYSLGVTLYEVLTLRRPFEGRAVLELMDSVRTKEPPPPRRLDPRIPRDLETIVRKAMEKDAARRYATAGEMARDLRLCAEGGAIRARRIGPVGRAWRRAKRHKTASILAAGLMLAVGTAAVLGARAARERDGRREAEYESLCAQAEQALIEGIGGGDPRAGGSIVQLRCDAVDRARDALGRAIALCPDAAQAYVARALAPGRLEERLSDLEAARVRGLGAGTYHWARALVHGLYGKWEQAHAEARLGAADASPASGMDAYLEGRLLAAEGKPGEAVERLGRAIDSPDTSPYLRALARCHRALARSATADVPGALEDLAGAVGTGTFASPLIRVWMASLWRKAAHRDRAEAMMEGLRDEARGLATASAWSELCVACEVGFEWTWLDRVSAEGMAAYPEDEPLALLRVLALAHVGKPEEGLALARRLAAAHPERGYLHAQLGNALRWANRFEEAVAEYDLVLATQSDLVGALAGRAWAFYCLGRNEKALADVEAVLAQAPNAWGPNWLRGLVLGGLGRFEAALPSFARTLEINPGFAKGWSDLGVTLLELGRLPPALDAFDHDLAIAPDDERPHVHRAATLWRMGRKDEGLAEFERAAKLGPKGSWGLGSALHELGRDAEAVEPLRRAADALPADLNLLRMLAEALETLDRRDEALPYRERVAARSPNDAWDAFSLAQDLYTMDRTAEATAAVRRSLDLGHDDLAVCAACAGLLFNLSPASHLAESLAAFDRALAMTPKGEIGHEQAAILAQARAQRACVLLRLGRASEALAEVDRAGPTQPRLPSGWWASARADILHALGREEEALAVCDAAEKADPKAEIPHLERAYLLGERGRYVEAVAACRKGLAVVSGATAAGLRRCLASCLLALDRRGEAEAIAREAVPTDARAPRDADTAYLCAVAGHTEAAIAYVHSVDRASGRESKAYDCALITGLLGRSDEALSWLDLARERGFLLECPDEVVAPELRTVEADPRFRAWLEAVRRR